MLILRIFGDARAPPVPEVLLARDSLEGAGEEGPFDLVTVTDAPERASGLRTSVPWPLHIRFLRPADSKGGEPWRFRWFDTERHLLSYVSYLRRHGQGDRLVVYVDGFDTAWMGCTRNFSAALSALGRQMFFGVEFDLYPAGLPGYLQPAGSHHAAAEELGRERGQPLENCREHKPLMERWEFEPPPETEPCLAITDHDGKTGIYLNGGVYGGRAAALEAALRRFLAKQRLLTIRQASGDKFRESGRTHQYLWNQFFLDRRHEVGLDYGGAFVVNLARRSVAPSQFGLADDGASIRSVLFQRSVCVAHANGAGYADNTMSLLRAAAAFRFDTTALAGVSPDDFDALAMQVPLKADLDRGDRVILDTSMCFSAMGSVATWHGVLSAIDLVTPEHFATYQGLQLLVLRPRGTRGGAGPGGAAPVFEVAQAQDTALWKRGPPERQNATFFGSRQRFEIDRFRLRVRQDECVGWRCQGRCDFAYADFSEFPDVFSPPVGTDARLPRRGVWRGQVKRGGLKEGDLLTFGNWKLRAYILGARAEVTGVGFYEPEDGG